MTRRKTFDPGTVPLGFWRREDVQEALVIRDVGRLFRLFLETFPDCTQTQLALFTQHDRSDISNWIRGIRQGRVSDIEVLLRVADGLQLPDQARTLLGLASVDTSPLTYDRARSGETLGKRNIDRATAVTISGPVHIAICGSRATDTNTNVIGSVIRCLARLVMSKGYKVSHGPIGVGIEVMTYIADCYRPPDFTLAIGFFGHRNVIQDAEFVIVIGGAAGTRTEIDLALSMGKKIVALPASGGTARRFYDRARRDSRLHAWMTDEDFAALDACPDPGEDFTRIIEYLIEHEHRSPT